MFRSGWTIAHVRGVPIRLHVSLLFILPTIGWWLTAQGAGGHTLGHASPVRVLHPVVFGAALTFALLVTIVAHELGHALVALGQGATVRGITLMALGGVTEIAHRDASPSQQFWVAVAGPLVNAFFAVMSFAIVGLVHGLPADVTLLVAYLGLFNLFVTGFNLLPAFPLDGGRILRALLRTRMSTDDATRVAARVGRLLAVTGGVIALARGMPGLLIVSVFVFLGAGLEEASLEIRESLAGLPLRLALVVDVATVAPTTDAAVARRHLRALDAEVALVRDLDGLYGVVTGDLLRRSRGPVRDLVEGAPVRMGADDDLQQAFDVVRRTGAPVVVVDDANAIIGVVSGASIARSVTRSGPPTHAPAPSA